MLVKSRLVLCHSLQRCDIIMPDKTQCFLWCPLAVCLLPTFTLSLMPSCYLFCCLREWPLCRLCQAGHPTSNALCRNKFVHLYWYRKRYQYIKVSHNISLGIMTVNENEYEIDIRAQIRDTTIRSFKVIRDVGGLCYGSYYWCVISGYLLTI